MRGGGRLIWTGFALAGAGFLATCCLILGFSAAYLGRFRAAAVLLVAAATLFFIFARRLRAYFNALERHEIESQHQD